MKKFALIIALFAMSGCGSQLTSISKRSRENISNACQIVEAKKKLFYQPSKQSVRAQPGRAMVYSGYKPLVVAKPSGIIPANSKQPSVDSTISISVDTNEDVLIESKNKFNPGIEEKVSPKQTIGSTAQFVKNRNAAKQNHKFKETAHAVLAMGLATLLAAGLFKASEKRMKRLSRWANEHPILARTSIVGAQSIASIAGLSLGHYLFNEGVAIPEYALWSSAGAFTAALSFYPNKYSSGSIPLFSYFKRKIHDIALCATGAMMMVYAGNHYNVVSKADNAEKIIYSAASTQSSTGQFHLVKNNVRLAKTDPARPERTRGEKIGLTILASIGFSFLLLLVAAASCSLSCSGNQGMAALVMLVGGGLVIWGLVAVIRSIWKKQKVKTTQVSMT